MHNIMNNQLKCVEDLSLASHRNANCYCSRPFHRYTAQDGYNYEVQPGSGRLERSIMQSIKYYIYCSDDYYPNGTHFLLDRVRVCVLTGAAAALGHAQLQY